MNPDHRCFGRKGIFRSEPSEYLWNAPAVSFSTRYLRHTGYQLYLRYFVDIPVKWLHIRHRRRRLKPECLAGSWDLGPWVGISKNGWKWDNFRRKENEILVKFQRYVSERRGSLWNLWQLSLCGMCLKIQVLDLYCLLFLCNGDPQCIWTTRVDYWHLHHLPSKENRREVGHVTCCNNMISLL